MTITQANIRFLKFSDSRNGWVEISSTEARDKITHALRFAQKRSSRKSKKNVPQRQGSDSTHRSETSATSATSYDWDQLLQTQQHLAGLSLGNMNSSLRASRSSFSSTGSASLLSKDLSKDSSHSSARKRGRSHSTRSKTKTKSKSKVSFEPSVCSGGLSTIYSGATKESSNTSSTLESIPLPVDLSSTQHSDMHQSQTNLTIEAGDRPPRMPSRPTEEEAGADADDEDDEDAEEEDVNGGFDTIMNSTNTGFGEMLDPLVELEQENMRDSDSHSTDSENEDNMPLQKPMVAPNGDLLPLPNNHLSSLGPLHSQNQLDQSAMMDPIMSNDNLLEEVGAELLGGLADMGIDRDHFSNRLPPPILEGQELEATLGETFQPMGGLEQHHPHIDNGTGGYSQLLMQEPLWEWEPRGGTNQGTS